MDGLRGKQNARKEKSMQKTKDPDPDENIPQGIGGNFLQLVHSVEQVNEKQEFNKQSKMIIKSRMRKR